MGWCLGCLVHDQTGYPVEITRRIFPRLVFSREFKSTCFTLRSPAIRTGNIRRKGRQVRSVQGARQYNLDGSSLQVGWKWNEHQMVDYTTADKDGCTAPHYRSACAVQA